MKVYRNLKAGKNGTIKLLRKYGEQLICVRFRSDMKNKKRYKTIELIIDEWNWEPPKKYEEYENVSINEYKKMEIYTSSPKQIEKINDYQALPHNEIEKSRYLQGLPPNQSDKTRYLQGLPPEQSEKNNRSQRLPPNQVEEIFWFRFRSYIPGFFKKFDSLGGLRGKRTGVWGLPISKAKKLGLLNGNLVTRIYP